MSLEFNFVLPHLIYWGGLFAFPLAYMLILKLGLIGAGRSPEPEAETHPTTEDLEAGEGGYKGVDVPGNAFTRFADRLSLFSGIFLSAIGRSSPSSFISSKWLVAISSTRRATGPTRRCT